MKINIPANTKTVILNMVSNEMIELKKAANDAKVKLGLSNSELSKLIGHSRNYLSEALRVGATTEKLREIQAKVEKAVEIELINRGVVKSECSIDVSCGQDKSVVNTFVSKAYHEQEVNNLGGIIKSLTDDLSTERGISNNNALIGLSRASELADEKQNVRMLNMEVEQLKQKNKDSVDDLAIANRDKNFMKRKLQDKNLVINWLIASNVFFVLFLVVKCAGWV